MAWYWYLIILVYLVGIPVSYKKWIKTWNNTKFEKIAFAIMWPLMVPLYLIWWGHNNF